jgi:hypothetical protein
MLSLGKPEGAVMTEILTTVRPSGHTRSALATTTTIGGGLFAALGLAFIVFGQEYRIGDLRSMGPGMFPIAGGGLLVLLGAAIVLSGKDEAEQVEPVGWRPLVGVLAAVVAFALLVDSVGLIVAGPVLIGGVLIATGQGTWRSGIVLSVVLTAVSSVVFPMLLGVPLRVLP